MAIDYAALAAQAEQGFGASSATPPVDYAALAAQAEQEFSTPAAPQEQDYPLTRGYNAIKGSVGLSFDIQKRNYKDAAENIAAQARYQKANPGTEASVGLQKAWKDGDGVLGSIGAVNTEMNRDVEAAQGLGGKIVATGQNLRAMGSGIIAQVPNMVLPMAGMVGGGLAGSSVAPGVGTVAGAWAGATGGNAMVGTSEAAMRQLEKAGIDPSDTAAVEAYLQANGGDVLKETLVKGAVIGAVDTATMGVGSKILGTAGKEAVKKTLVDAGVDVTNKAAVAAALKDPALNASAQAAFKAAKTSKVGNIAAASLEPLGEYAGEYGGSLLATGEADSKDAFLEAVSSLGQSGLTFAGQKIYAGAKMPFEKVTAPLNQVDEEQLLPLEGETQDMFSGEYGPGLRAEPAAEEAAVVPSEFRKDVKDSVLKAGGDLDTANAAALSTDAAKSHYAYLRKMGMSQAMAIEQSINLANLAKDVPSEAQGLLFGAGSKKGRGPSPDFRYELDPANQVPAEKTAAPVPTAAVPTAITPVDKVKQDFGMRPSHNSVRAVIEHGLEYLASGKITQEQFDNSMLELTEQSNALFDAARDPAAIKDKSALRKTARAIDKVAGNVADKITAFTQPAPIQDATAPSAVTVTNAAGEVKEVPLEKQVLRTANREIMIPASTPTATIPAPEEVTDEALADEYNQKAMEYLTSGIPMEHLALVQSRFNTDENVGKASTRALANGMKVSHEAARKLSMSALSSIKANAAAAGMDWEKAKAILQINTDKHRAAGGDSSTTSYTGGEAVTATQPDNFEFEDTAGFERTETAEKEGDIVEKEYEVGAVTEGDVSTEEVNADEVIQSAAEAVMSKYPPQAVDLTAELHGDGFADLPVAQQVFFVERVTQLARIYGHDEQLFISKANELMGVTNAKSISEGKPQASTAQPEDGTGEVGSREESDEPTVVIGKADISKVKVVAKKKRVAQQPAEKTTTGWQMPTQEQAAGKDEAYNSELKEKYGLDRNESTKTDEQRQADSPAAMPRSFIDRLDALNESVQKAQESRDQARGAERVAYTQSNLDRATTARDEFVAKDKQARSLGAPASITQDKVQTPSSVSAVRIAAASVVNDPAKHLQVYATVNDVPEVDRGLFSDGRSATYVPEGGYAIVVADRVEKGDELGIFLHEIGTHAAIPTEILMRLAERVNSWAKKESGNGFEQLWAKNAVDEVNKNEADRVKRGLPKYTAVQRAHEEVATLAQMLVNQTTHKGGAIEIAAFEKSLPVGLRSWFNTLKTALSKAMRNLYVNPDKFTPQNFVDVIAGHAAKLYAGEITSNKSETFSGESPAAMVGERANSAERAFKESMKEVEAMRRDGFNELADVLEADAVKMRVENFSPENSMLELAKSMEGVDKSADEIVASTGWFRGPDALWRRKISDADASLRLNGLSSLKNVQLIYAGKDIKMTLAQMLKHDKLFQEYPALRNVKVEAGGDVLEPGNAYFMPGTPATIRLSRKDVEAVMASPSKRNQSDLISLLMHEIQHWIQEEEGFAKGGGAHVNLLMSGDVLQQLAKQKKAGMDYGHSAAIEMARADKKVGGKLHLWMASFADVYLDKMLNNNNINEAQLYLVGNMYGVKAAEAIANGKYQINENDADAFLRIMGYNVPVKYSDATHLHAILDLANSVDDAAHFAYESLVGEQEARHVMNSVSDRGGQVSIPDYAGEGKRGVVKMTHDVSRKMNSNRSSSENTDYTEASENIGEVKDPHTKASFAESLKGMFFSAARTARLITVYETADEAIAAGELDAAHKDTATAWVNHDKKRIFIIAGRVGKGQELGIILHEVGVHFGMENLVGKENMDWLRSKVQEWAMLNDGSIESEAANAALRRANKSTSSNVEDEVVAYMVEELANRGAKPSAMGATPLARWYRRLFAGLKSALRRLGFKSDRFSPQNLMDLAYGAAHMELAEASGWHGTAADFRKFNHAYMNSGEGAQAFGWGTYIAQRVGIAKDYWKQDVQRKGLDKQDAASWSKLELKLESLKNYLHNPNKDQYSNTTYKGKELKYSDESLDAATLVGTYLRDGNTFAQAVDGADRDLRNAYGYDGMTAEELRQIEASHKQLPTLDEADFSKKLDSKAFNEALDAYNNDLAEIKDIEAQLATPKSKGSLMRVAATVHDDEMLDWDKPLSEQSEKVQKIIADNGMLTWENVGPGVSGERLYRAIVMRASETELPNYAGSEESSEDYKKAASMHLDSLGIKGIKFLDSSSRGSSTSYQLAHWEKRVAEHTESLKRRPNNEFVKEQLAKAVENRDAARKELDENPETSNIVIFNDKNIIRVANFKGAKKTGVQFSEFTSALGDAIADPKHTAETHGMGYLTLTQLGEVYSKVNSAVPKYLAAVRKMQSTSKQWVQKAARIDVDWARVKDADPMHMVMREATRAGYDPSATRAIPATIAERSIQVAYNKLSPEAKAVFTKARDYYAEMRTERNKVFEGLIGAAFDDRIAKAQAAGDTAAVQRAEDKKAKELSKHKDMVAQVKGPYFPLMRIGKYYVVAMSKELAALDAITDKTKTDTDRIAKLRLDPAHYKTSTFDTLSKARKAERELGKTFASVRHNVVEEENNATKVLSAAGLKDVMDYVEASFSGSTKAVGDQLREMMADLYYQSLPENHALKRELKREGVHGEEMDMRRVFAVSSMQGSHYLSRVKHADDVKAALYDIKAEGRDGTEARDVYNEVAKRAALSMENTQTPVSDLIVSASYLAHLGLSPAFIITNAMQVPMITGPWLIARSSAKAAHDALSDALGKTAGMVKSSYAAQGWRFELDWTGKVSAAEGAMLDALMQRSLIDITIEHDLGAVAGAKHHKIGEALKMASLPVHVTELANRSITALAAYNVAVNAKKMSHEDAVDFAAQAVSTTQLDYSALNAPRHMQRVAGSASLAKVMMQFRKYQQGMLYLTLRSMHQMVKGESAEVRKDARRTMFGLGVTTAAMAGTVGLPLAGTMFWVAGLVASLFGDDDEEWDAEEEYKDWLADEFGEVGAAIAKGLPAAMLNIDMSKRLGMADLASPLPFARDGKTPRESLGEKMIAAGGAPVSMGLGVWEGMEMIADGDVAKGLEKVVLLKGASNLIKSYRMADEGLTTKNGEVILPPNKFDEADILATGLGFQPNQSSTYYEANSYVERKKAAAKEARADLIKEYAQAKMRGESTASAQRDIAEFNSRHPQQGVKIDRSTLYKSVQTRKANAKERNKAGIRTGKANKPYLDDVSYAE